MTPSCILDGVPTPCPPCIEFDPITRIYKITCTEKEDLGLWDITTTVTVTDPVTGVDFSQDESFSVNIVSDCVHTNILDDHYQDMSSVIGGVADVQNMKMEDTVAMGHGDPNYCGERTYILDPGYPFLSFDGNNMEL